MCCVASSDLQGCMKQKSTKDSFWIMAEVKTNLLDMEAAMGLIRDSLCGARSLVDRRRAWRRTVKEATSAREVSF